MKKGRAGARRRFMLSLVAGMLAAGLPPVPAAAAPVPFSIDASYAARFEHFYTTQFPSRWTNQVRGTAWRTAHDASALWIRDEWRRLLKPLQAEGAFSELRPFNFADPTGTMPDNTDPVVGSGPENNVLAFVPGSDPALRTQIVVIGGHYDCVDITVDGGLDCGMQIPITSAVLEALVRYWIANDIRPRRSLAAFAIDGEEQCLCGSVHYTTVGSPNALAEHLEFPPAVSVAAYHDTDMLGANYPNRLFGSSKNDFMPLQVFSAPAVEDPTRVLAPFAAYQAAIANPVFLARFKLYREALYYQRDRFFEEFHAKYPVWRYRDGVTKPLFTDDQKKYVNIIDDPLNRSDHTVLIVQGIPGELNIGLNDPTAAPPGWVAYHHVGETQEEVFYARSGSMTLNPDVLLGYEATSAWIAYMSGAGEDTDPALGPFFLGETAPASLPAIEGIRLSRETAVLPEMPASEVRTAWRLLGPRSAIVRALTVDPRDPLVLYAATQDRGFMVSRDRGRTWTESNRGLGPFTSLWSVDADPRVPKRLWAATHHGGVFRSDDAGASWKPTGGAARRRPKDAVFAAPANPVTSTQLLEDNATFDQDGANAGGKWLYVYDQCLAQFAPAGQPCATRADWPPEGFDPYPPVADFYRFASETAVMGNGAVLAAGFSSSAGAQGGVFRSANAGASWKYHWSNAEGGSVGNSNVWRIRRASPTRVYAAGTGGVFRSDDAGVTWVAASPQATEVRALAVDPTNANVAYAGAWDAGGGIFKTVDAGQTWAPASEGIPPRAGIAALAVDPRNPRRLAAATYWYGVYLSEDAGATWKLAATGMPTLARQRLDDVDFSSDGSLYASSHHGVFVMPGPSIVRGIRRPARELPETGVGDWGWAWLLLAGAVGIGRFRTSAR